MGAGQSIPSHTQPPSKALHVLRVTPSSPASITSIEPFFDFVVGFQGDSLSHNVDAAELEKIVESHEGRTLNLVVWSSKDQESRVVPIIPSREWTQTNPGPQAKYPGEIKPSLLGLSMRMCEPELSLDNVWHVLDVLEGSPAESAGLVPYGDWIIGWSGGVLGAEGDFYDVVEAHLEKPLRVYVYSYDFDTIREVVLVPNRQWGGDGLLGCVFGFGLLHRIPQPPPNREPGAIPPDLFENADEFEDQQLFVPADFSQQAIEAEHYDEWQQNFYSNGSQQDEDKPQFLPSDGHSGHSEHLPNIHEHHESRHGNQEVHGSPLATAVPFRRGQSNRPQVMSPIPTRIVSNGSENHTNGIGFAGTRPQADDQTTNAWNRGDDGGDFYPAGSTANAEIIEEMDEMEVTSDVDGDSGSLTSVD